MTCHTLNVNLLRKWEVQYERESLNWIGGFTVLFSDKYIFFSLKHHYLKLLFPIVDNQITLTMKIRVSLSSLP